MPGGMGKDSKSEKSYKSTCEEVDVKILGNRKLKKYAKKNHHKAIRKEGKRQINKIKRILP